MNISASAQKSTAAIAAKRFLTEQQTLEIVQGAIDAETAPLTAENASLRNEINALQAAAVDAQHKFNLQLGALQAELAVAKAAPIATPAASPAIPSNA